MENDFINKLFLASSGEYVAAKVVEATDNYAQWWHVNVQSIIKEEDPTRPDSAWDWVSLVKGTHPAVRLATWSGQRPRAFCIVVSDEAGRTFPVGMILLVEKYVYLPDHTKAAPFTWFLAGAPGSFLKDKLNGRRPRLLTALVDIGIVVSFAKECNGRLCLHSAPEGGSMLIQKYKDCGLMQLPLGSRLPIGRALWRQLTQADDSIHNYLYADTNTAEAMIKQARYGGE